MQLIKLESYSINPTMSTQEIADLLGCRHDNVKVTIERLHNKGLITFTASQEKGNGRPKTIYHVNKRDSYVVVAQLSPEFTGALVDRWQELEQDNNSLRTRVARVSELLAMIKINGSIWGKAGNEQKKSKKEAKQLMLELINQVQLELF